MATNIDRNTRGAAGREAGDVPDAKPSRPKDQQAGSHVQSDEDYRDASGRDHPSESEHDHAPESEPGHARQKLNGKSAKMAKQPPQAGTADTTGQPDKS